MVTQCAQQQRVEVHALQWRRLSARLPEAVQQVLLYGSGEEEIKFSYALESGERAGKKIHKKHPFEGIIRNFERRYRETDSVAVREELARYRATQPCPDCGGARLNRSARNVFVADRPLPSRRMDPVVAFGIGWVLCAIGIHGQWLYVDPSTETTIVKLSSQPNPLDDELKHDNFAFFRALSAWTA